MTSFFLSLFKIFIIYLRKRERMSRRRSRGRGRGKNLRLPAECRAQLGAQFQHPKIMTWAKTKSPMLNWLSSPRCPPFPLLLYFSLSIKSLTLIWVTKMVFFVFLLLLKKNKKQKTRFLNQTCQNKVKLELSNFKKKNYLINEDNLESKLI